MNNQEKELATSEFRILAIEDNKVDQMILESMLMENMDPTTISLKLSDSLGDAIDQLNKRAFDVVILDLNLPDSKGEDTLTRLCDAHSDVAVVVCTGAYEDNLGLKTLSLGAQDFLVKGNYSAGVLIKTLEYAVERKRLQVELGIAYQILKDTQIKLIHSEKMKIIGSLASGVAHEVKNPLAAIIYGVTYLDEQLGEKKDKNISTVLESLKESADRANNIIMDLLDFSAVKNLHKQPESINKLTEKSIQLIRYQLDQKGITVDCNLGQEIPKVDVDANRLVQVMINVIMNSANAITEKGVITITSKYIEVTPSNLTSFKLNPSYFSSGDHVVLLTIDDTGPGILDEHLEHIFDPFYTTRRSDGGVGMGLTVSQSIMDSHEGHIGIERLPKEGTRVILALKA